jgi:zinc and cadmium transporter|tara:strand:+ start:50614 stop:51378 length:765 start_codon:yes stop_codon:yes gene_type:complete
MTVIALYAFVSVIVVSLISLIGIVTLSWNREFLQRSILVLVSLAVGALLGDAFIHLIPEAFAEIENTAIAALWVIIGMLSFFVLEKFLRWHHGHGEGHEHDESEHKIQPLGFLVLTSDGIHNLLDGIIIGASYFVSIEVGIATTIAVLLHEIPQEISDFGLLIHAGFSKAKALVVNFLTALSSFVGVGIVFAIQNASETFVPLAAAFSAGAFIYIAGSDLVPELHKTREVKRSLIQLTAMLVGIGLMFALLLLE